MSGDVFELIEDFVILSGYPGLFVISFLAATLIPLGSEIFVVSMTLSGCNPWMIFAAATTGNTLGSITNYYVGKRGAEFMLSRYIKVDSQKRENVERIYRKWGSPILLFAWIPVVGDPLTVVAGGLNLNLYVFTFWVILGKAFRYVLVILTAKSF
jgi:membrane protein YqaA with SNARE-associated domain